MIPPYKNVNFGALGGSPEQEAWKDFLQTTSALTQQQMMMWTGAFQQLLLGEYDQNEWMRTVMRLYTSGLQSVFALGAFPWMWWGRFMGDVPSVVFVIDRTYQATDPQVITTPVSLPKGYPVLVTDLSLVGGTGSGISSKDHVQATLLEDGNRISVRLVELMTLEQSTPQEAKLDNRLKPGAYVGLIYGKGGTARRPLAILHVQVLESAPQADPPGEGLRSEVTL